MSLDLRQVSRAISHALRHAPWLVRAVTRQCKERSVCLATKLFAQAVSLMQQALAACALILAVKRFIALCLGACSMTLMGCITKGNSLEGY